MEKHKRDDYLIVVSSVVAILATKIADFLFPLSPNMKITGNTSLDPWLGLLFILILIIALVAFLILPIVKLLAKRVL